MAKPYGQCEEAVHVSDSNDHNCDQVYYSRFNEDVGLSPGYYCVASRISLQN